MNLQSHIRALLLATLFLGAACQEPVDCVQEPARCPNRPIAPAPVTPRPGSAPSAVGRPLPLPVAVNHGQRMLQLPPGPGVAGRQPSQEPLARPAIVDNAPLPTGAPSREELKALLASVQAPTQARDFEALKPLITPRLYTTLTPLIAKDGDRLWRHLAKYTTAMTGGFKTEVDSAEGDHVQLHLTLSDGSDTRPILTHQDGAWKIDRF